MRLLTDQVALITGGTAGIGKEIALRFAEEGARIAIFGRNQAKGEQVINELRDRFPESEPVFFPTDVAQPQAVEESVQKVLTCFTRVDILVNNAGITRDQLILRMSDEEWDCVLETNLKSCFLLCRSLAKSMLRARKGKIINMSSVVGLMGNKGQTNYAASKAAIIGLTKSLAKELASRGIRVNAIAPGFIETAMTEALSDKAKEEILRTIPMERMGTPREVADVALFLASSLSNYLTGQVIVPGGGMDM